MDNFFEELDFEKTVRDFEFTRRAMRGISTVVNSRDFEDMDAEMIFRFLFREMEMVSFRDYLKRYIYMHAQMEEPFWKLEDDVFRQIIMDSFEENQAPHSFEPTTKKWSAQVKSWLNQENARRQTVFLLGFGLRMSSEDVSDFLTKVLKEEDFDYSNAQEVVFWYCYRNQLPWREAQRLLALYRDLKPKPLPLRFRRLSRSELTGSKRFDLSVESNLLSYLSFLKLDGSAEDTQKIAYAHFERLLKQAKEEVAKIWQQDEDEAGSGKIIRAENISSADIEKVICSGIPVNKSGNLQKMSASVLGRHFRQRRMSRQRIDGVQKKQIPVERFDLITLLFFCHAQNADPDFPEENCRRYIEEIDGILEECGMMKIYPVNPYEAFVLMCLLSECPLATYSEIWELSYTDGT